MYRKLMDCLWDYAKSVISVTPSLAIFGIAGVYLGTKLPHLKTEKVL